MRDRTTFFIIGAAVAVALAASLYFSMPYQYIGTLDFAQQPPADALKFTARDLEDVKNDVPSQMNQTAFLPRATYESLYLEYCKSQEEIENNVLAAGEDGNPLVLKRGSEEFQSSVLH